MTPYKDGATAAHAVIIVYPDHLGNNQRLFDKYGPIFRSTNMGKTVCQTNDPVIGQIAFTESEFFSKEINDDHPLKPIKQEAAGVFVSDTSNPYVYSQSHVERTVHMLIRREQSVYLPQAQSPERPLTQLDGNSCTNTYLQHWDLKPLGTTLGRCTHTKPCPYPILN